MVVGFSVAYLTAVARITYWTIQHAVPLVATLLDVTLQRARVEGLKEFEAAEQLSRHGHHSTPVIKFTAVLKVR